MSESIDDTMLSMSVTRVRRFGAFGVVVAVVAIVILSTCCDIDNWFRVLSGTLMRSSCGTVFLVQDWFLNPDFRPEMVC